MGKCMNVRSDTAHPETFPGSVVPTSVVKPFPLLGIVDSEAKILNNVAAKLGDNTLARGTINLLTENYHVQVAAT
jgi:hypothetical protein